MPKLEPLSDINKPTEKKNLCYAQICSTALASGKVSQGRPAQQTIYFSSSNHIPFWGKEWEQQQFLVLKISPFWKFGWCLVFLAFMTSIDSSFKVNVKTE